MTGTLLIASTRGCNSDINLVKRTVSFNAYTTTKIRINITGVLGSFARITKIAAWGIKRRTAATE